MDASSIKNPIKILKLLNSGAETEKKIGYQAFLNRTHWKVGAKIESLKKFACLQLNIKSRNVLAVKKRIDPALLWASQDGLETAKLKMVEAASAYISIIKTEFPPIIVWNFFDSQAIRYIVHDGHHRSYYFHRMRKRVSAIILEPLGNYNLVEEKFRYAFHIRKRVIDLPVSRTKHYSIVTY